MGKLILIRHGETNKNVSNVLHSKDDPESLNELGKFQINKVADHLYPFLPVKIYSSDETRALESAEILSNALSVPVASIDGLQERNWGVFTGKPWSEVQNVLKPMSLEQRYNYVPQNGESWKEFETRLINAVNEVTKNIGDKAVAVVTHGGVIRALIPYLLQIPREESFKYNFDNASLSIFEYDGINFSKVIINDISYLK